MNRPSPMAAAAPLISNLPLSARITSEYNVGSRWKLRLPGKANSSLKDGCFLKVCDVNLASTNSPGVVADIKIQGEVAARLNALPEQTRDTIRVYITNLRDDVETYLRQLSSSHFQPSLAQLPWAITRDTEGLPALLAQWEDKKSSWYQTRSYQHSMNAAYIAKIALGEKQNYLVQDIAAIVGLSQCVWRISLADLADDKLAAIIYCETSEAKNSEISRTDVLSPALEDFTNSLLRENVMWGESITPSSKASSLKQHFLLRYHFSLLDIFTEFCGTVDNLYEWKKEALSNPRYSVLRSTLLQTVATDSHFGAEFGHIADDLANAILALLKYSKLSAETPDQKHQLSLIEARLTLQCDELKKITTRFSSRLENHLKFLELARNGQESKRLLILSILASVLLPLSVATGVLSMQTRFVDLHELLYDFCGVAVLAAALLLLVFGLVKLYFYAQEKAAVRTAVPRERKAGLTTRSVAIRRRVLTRVLWHATISFTGFILAVTVVSFIYGMLNSITTGAVILGCGLGAMTIYSALYLGVLAFGYYRSVSSAERTSAEDGIGTGQIL